MCYPENVSCVRHVIDASLVNSYLVVWTGEEFNTFVYCGSYCVFDFVPS